ncbi:hypothetical protein F0L74_13615 [Chitinophaga agrisoli]|uniref:HlyD family secretion protein n=1 Tax=Chitinophaga agrisoli TaxID=2607653 RepID=A0A5B2VWR3_9BACT|nr:hypothetical protein [Chitinophaga agrisoli]KAA2243525.1 hypothetical protein F0L74_13615 [Chitinophaga agrisoli]
MIQKSAYQHSFEVQEIIGKTPGWMVRWGITALFSTLFMLLLASAFISYPVVITPDVQLVLTPPLFYVQREAGETVTLQKTNGPVNAQAVLAVVADTSGNSRSIIAPYAGVVEPFGAFQGNDTLAVVIPGQAHYEFRGTLPAMYAKQNIKGARVNVIIAKNRISGERVVLQGTIHDISPVAVSGHCPFWGSLDPVSDKKLGQAAVLSGVCDGVIEITISERSVLKRIISGAII